MISPFTLRTNLLCKYTRTSSSTFQTTCFCSRGEQKRFLRFNDDFCGDDTGEIFLLVSTGEAREVMSLRRPFLSVPGQTTSRGIFGAARVASALQLDSGF